MSDNHRSRRADAVCAEVVDVRSAAAEALVRVQTGMTVTSDVAKLAAEVLANPPPLMAAARRFLGSVGTQEARGAALEFLAMLADEPP